MTDNRITLTRVGWRANLTDLGRRGSELSGVPSGGAADQHSASVANILAGNPRGAVLLEAIGPIGLVAEQPMLVAVAGAPAEVRVNGLPAGQWRPLYVPAGHEIRVGAGESALRTYVAIAGDIEAPRFLGSAAPDPRMNFLQQLGRGGTLTVQRQGIPTALDRLEGAIFRFDVPRFVPPSGPWTLDVVPAAEHDAVPAIRELMEASTYTVRPESDHVGVRLDGPVTHPARAEIVSHGVPVGAVEIPHADDELILLGRYRTLTAGYPIVGVVARTELDLIGQLAPGRSVRFRWVTRAEAVARAATRASSLAALEQAVGAAFAAQLGTMTDRTRRTTWTH